MATYTMELWEVLELETDIGLCHYPIFDEEYRKCLNDKIVQHFWNREIAMESISMFRQQLRKKMNEIMPFWNQQYVASQKQFDPLKTMSITTVSGTVGNATVTATGESTANGNSTSTSDAKSRAVASTFPQQQLSGTGDYADSAQDNISNTTAAGTSGETGTTANTQSSNNSGSVDSETSGYQGNPAILIAEWRATMVNTDMDVINQLETLFMGIWDSSDNYFEGALSYGFYSRGGFSF